MSRRNYWRKRADIDQYIQDLEDVYSINVVMDFEGIPGPGTLYRQRVILKGYWQGDDQSTGPMAYHQEEILYYPDEKYIKTMLHALVAFTYQCVEAHISALSKLN